MKNASTFWRARLVRALPLAALALVSLAQAGTAVPSSWRTDCVGYHTIQLPGDIEYAVQYPRFNRQWSPKFADGLGVWSNNAYVHIDGDDVQDASVLAIRVTSETDAAGLKVVLNSKNAEQQKSKEDLLRQASLFTEQEVMGKTLLQQAKDQPFYEPIPDRAAFSIPSKRSGLLDFQVLIGNRIVSATRKLAGTPQQTVDAFLSHYKPREPFEVPNGPGVCLPYATMTGEPRPATVGMSIGLNDRPDIVVYLHDTTVDTDGKAEDIKDVLSKEIDSDFYAAKYTDPSNKLKPFHRVTIAGQEGLGAFVVITRKHLNGKSAVHNEKNDDKDWGYIAYVPGDKKAPLGTSSDLLFQVERYGRFAKQPMTEKEFRKLTETIAASIKRRPGAWVGR